HRHPLAVEDGELRAPVVVVVLGRADLDVVAVGLDLEALQVRGEPLAVDRPRAGDEDVDAEGRRAQLAKLADLGPQRRGGDVAAGQKAEAAGAADGGGELGGGGAAGKRRLDDRVIEFAEDHRLARWVPPLRASAQSKRAGRTPKRVFLQRARGSLVDLARSLRAAAYGTSSTYSHWLAVSVFGPPLQVSWSGPPKRWSSPAEPPMKSWAPPDVRPCGSAA